LTPDAFRRIDAFIQVGIRLARNVRSGRVLLARIADAIDPQWIPRPWGDEIAAELERASAAAREPVELRQIERALRGAWGVRPTEELDELEPEPVAVTPTSQVHRGALEGATVAVKVLRPGLAASVRQDVAQLQALVAPLGAAFPALDAGAVVREFRERVLEELDLESEAGAQRRFHRALRGHPFLLVPAPVTRLSHEGVLVSEWVEGVPLWEAPDPDEAAARLVVFALGAAVTGIVHADPAPEDVLVMPDGRLAILDFGAVGSVDQDRLGAAVDALDSFSEGDEGAFAAALATLGALPPELGARALELATYALGELAGPEPARLDSAAVLAARDRLLSRSDSLLEILVAGTLPPQDLWPARAVAQLFGTIARVGATGPWRELARAALRGGFSAPVA
jgi:predicted unusual protein kinase regulating ubiquinone biosynthesis (AarF/ABC1/UbiB family)